MVTWRAWKFAVCRADVHVPRGGLTVSGTVMDENFYRRDIGMFQLQAVD